MLISRKTTNERSNNKKKTKLNREILRWHDTKNIITNIFPSYFLKWTLQRSKKNINKNIDSREEEEEEEKKAETQNQKFHFFL